MLSKSKDLQYLSLVQIMGGGDNWYYRPKMERISGKKIWSVMVKIPWDVEKKVFYIFEMDDSEEQKNRCRYYSVNENGKISSDVIYRYVNCGKIPSTKNNLLRFINKVIALKWKEKAKYDNKKVHK